MKIEEVTEKTVAEAGRIHSESWRESHRGFCSPGFIAQHTYAAQTEYLRREMAAGKRLYMLTDEEPVGIVSVWGSLIENLYVLPEFRDRGYGTRLLRYAVERCDGTPSLWILNINQGAYRLYLRNGFRETGNRKERNGGLFELELCYDRLQDIRQAEKISHEQAYAGHGLYEPGSWLAKPVKTVLELLPLFSGREGLRVLDLGCGVGRNSIPAAQAFPGCQVDCVDILLSAIERLAENARVHGVSGSIRGILSGIDEFAIEAQGYDLILAISALEHMDSRESLLAKLQEIRNGLQPGGIVCLVVNTNVREWDVETGQELPPQFEVKLTKEELQSQLDQAFGGWEILKATVAHQRYEIPRGFGMARLETDVVTFAARKT